MVMIIKNKTKDQKVKLTNWHNFTQDVFFEIPSNILLKKLSPRIWLSICGIGFGLVMVFQGLTQNYSGILATRFFLGLFECGMFPGCFYLLGMWYKRSEAQKRFTFFFCSTSLAGAFGGLLASAIGKSKETPTFPFKEGYHLKITYIASSGRSSRIPWMALDLHYRGCHHRSHLSRIPLCVPHLVSHSSAPLLPLLLRAGQPD